MVLKEAFRVGSLASKKRLAAMLALTTLGFIAGEGSAGPGPQRRKPEEAPVVRLPSLPPAVVDDTLSIGGQDVEGRKVESRMTVAVKVNGQGPFRFVVDSGADSSVIGRRLARSLQLPTGAPVMVHGMTTSQSVGQVSVDTLDLGQTSITDLMLPVLQDQDLGAAGMIGIDALVEQRLMLDFEKRVIRVEDARKPPRRADGDIVVVARRRRGQLILTQAKVNGGAVEAVIDTGSQVTIGNEKLRKQIVRRSRDKLVKATMTDVNGASVEVQLARVAVIRLGPIMLQNVLIAFYEVRPFALFGLSSQPALLLGTDLMETFRRVSLDFRARKVRFQLRRCSSQGVFINTSPLNSGSSRLSAEGTACR